VSRRPRPGRLPLGIDEDVIDLCDDLNHGQHSLRRDLINEVPEQLQQQNERIDHGVAPVRDDWGD
jgi:hypothetical protein